MATALAQQRRRATSAGAGGGTKSGWHRGRGWSETAGRGKTGGGRWSPSIIVARRGARRCRNGGGLWGRIAPRLHGRPAAWLDCCFDLIANNPFLSWREPSEFVRLARTIAGRCPLPVFSDRDSLADRMAVLPARADDAIGWAEHLPELPARCAASRGVADRLPSRDQPGQGSCIPGCRAI